MINKLNMSRRCLARRSFIFGTKACFLLFYRESKDQLIIIRAVRRTRRPRVTVCVWRALNNIAMIITNTLDSSSIARFADALPKRVWTQVFFIKDSQHYANSSPYWQDLISVGRQQDLPLLVEKHRGIGYETRDGSNADNEEKTPKAFEPEAVGRNLSVGIWTAGMISEPFVFYVLHGLFLGYG